MKRQIEFKAWHIEEKKMCEVSVINLSKGAFLVGVKLGPDLFDEEDEEKEFNLTPQDGRFCYFDEFELLQFTGLTDKNGMKIFEGDICKYGNDTNCEIIFENQYFCATIEGSECRTHLHIMGGVNKWEVIGNIHDNPELIK